MQKIFSRHTLSIDTQKKILFFPVFVFLFFLGNVSKSIAGDVVINEFLVDPDNIQWVEIYNISDSQVDIGGWIIDDSGGSQHLTVPSGTSIDPKGYKIFESGLFNFNKSSSDNVRLLRGDILEDSYLYTVGPPTNSSFGRESDGSSVWVIFQNPTKGSTNNGTTSSPIPSPSPTLDPPTNTPSPTKSPTPTKTPTPIKSPTPTKTPTPGKSGPTSTKTPIPTTKFAATKPSFLSTITERDITAVPNVTKVYPTAVLGASNSAAAPTGISLMAVLGEQTKKSNTDPIFIALPIIGVGLISGGVFYYLKKRRNSDI